ncbi:MAG: hypothetical protein ACRCX2_36650 [Paraclostridium sp.]
MGWYIDIGELKVYEEKDDDGSVLRSFGAEQTTHKDAPYLGFGDVSYDTNSRHPSYAGFGQFVTDVGLRDFFYEEIMGNRSNSFYTELEENHLETIRKAIDNYLDVYPDAPDKIPSKDKEPEGFRNKSWEDRDAITDSMDFDWNYGKLKWYEFWIDWALRNCDKPVIAFS